MRSGAAKLKMAVLALSGVMGSPVWAGGDGAPQPSGEQAKVAGQGVESGWLECGVRVQVRPMPGTKRVSVALVVAGGAVLEGRDERGLTEAVAWSWVRPDTDEPGRGGPNEGGGPPGPPPGGPPGGMGGGPGWRRSLRVEPCPEGLVVRANVSPERLADTLDAIVKMIKTPECDAARLERWRDRATKMLEGRGRSVERTVAAALMDVLVPDEIPGDGQPLTEEGIAGINVERTGAWLRERIVTSPMELAIAGPVEGAEAMRLAGNAFAGVAKRDPIGPLTFADRRVAHRVIGPVNERMRLELPAGTAHVVAGFSGPDIGAIDDVRALNLAAEVARRRLDNLCSDGKLAASMCMVRLMPARMHPGLGAMLVSTRVPDEDEAVGPALTALQLLLDDLLIQGPKPEELVDAGASLADDAEKKLGEPDYWAACLSISTLQGLTPESLAGAPVAYRTMTADRVHEVLKHWCVARNRFSLVARPREVP